MADDYRNSYNGAGVLGSVTPGGSATGSIEVAGDEDIFAISLVAGRTYTLEIQGVSSGFTVADPSFYFRDGSGSAIGFSTGLGGGSTNDRLIFTARTSATFYIDAFGGGGTGTYRVLADAGFVDDFRDSWNDTIEALGALTPGGSTTGNFEIANDEDIFAVSLVAGRTYTIEIQGVSSGFTVADPSFYLRDSSGSAAGFSSGIGGGNTNDRLIFTARASGTFYVDAFSGGGTGTYRVLADAGFVDDYRDAYNDTIEALGSLTIGGSADGTFEIANDEDIFQVSLVAGQTYTFEIQGASSGFTVADPSFYLRDGAGSAVGFSTGIGGGSTNDRLVHTATTSGTYYIDAFGGGGTGTYRIVAPGNFADDFRDTWNDTTEALGTVAPGASANGMIEIANDQDIFSVNLTAGRTYTIDMQGASSGGFTLADPSFYLRNSAGSAVGFSVDADGASTDNRLIFTAAASGTYYIDAFGVGGTGNYRLLVDTGFVDDFRDAYNDTVEALGALAPGGSATGNRELADDKDFFRISLAAGQAYVFDMEGASSGFTLGDPSFVLRDSAGGAVGFSLGVGGGSTNDRLTYTATASGFYYVDAAGIGTGTYRLLASAGVPAGDDYRNTTNGAGALGSVGINGSSLGRIETGGDKDVFAVALTAGQTYTFDLFGSANGGAALSNTYLSLLNGAGSVLLSNDNFSGTNSRISYTASSSGTFYLEAKGGTAALTGGYILSASTGFDDYRDSWNGSGTLGVVAINKLTYGTIETGGDKDVFKVTLVAGQTYTFDLAGSANGGTALSNSYLSLLNSSGSVLFSNDNFNGGNSRISYTATASGTYYLEAKGATSILTGTYIVSAKTGFDDFRDSWNGAGTLGSVVINKATYGTIEAGADTDIFAVTLTAGQNYTFDLTGSANGGAALANGFLRLLSSSGTALLGNDNYNGVNSRIVYTATSSGTYYLEAGSATSSGTGGYLVAAKADFDDLRDTFNGAGVLGSMVINKSTLGAIEEGADKDIFRVTLTAGESYSFELGGSANGGTALSNAYLSLLNGAGTVLFSNDNFNGNNSRIVYTATSSGTYYLEAKGATATLAGNYYVLARSGFDDLRDSWNGAGTLGTLAISKAIYGAIETGGDQDIFTVTLTAGQSYTFDLSASNNGGAALSNAYLSLLGSTGTVLFSNDNFNGNNSRIVYTATVSGTFYLEVKGATAAVTGNYHLSAKAGFDDLADTITDPASPLGTISGGQSRSGTIETAGNSDVFRFNLVAGREYSFVADGGTVPGLLSDGELQLFDSAGTLLAYNDDANASLDPEIEFVAAATGTYYLDVSGVKNAIGMYTVSIFDIT